MNTRSRWMEVDESERADYLLGLRSAYGDEILVEDCGIQAAYQRKCEALRHRLNSRFQPRHEETDPGPRRLLVSATQRCTFACSHCWVFASPKAGCVLSLDDLDTIHRHTSAHALPRWTVSGGEFFTLPYYADALERYPIDCVFTNGFWGYPRERCHKTIERIRSALNRNPYLKDRLATFILSYDAYHVAASGESLPLGIAIANIIAEFYRTLPDVMLRISHARSSPQDDGYRDVANTLEKEGFSISQTGQIDRNGNIANLSFHYQKGESLKKEIFIDTYPISPVCRALLHNPVRDFDLGATHEISSPPRARYQFAIGPDGGVGLYQILYAPPVPYWLGDLIHEPWSTVAERVSRDPIAVTLQESGIGPIAAFLEQFYPALLRSLAYGMDVTQPFLYHVLLDPDRRLHLNTYLLNQLLESGRLVRPDAHLQKSALDVLKARDADSRQKSLRQLYGNWPDG